jgi:MFS superfamily sulfate permease-like transporter
LRVDCSRQSQRAGQKPEFIGRGPGVYCLNMTDTNHAQETQLAPSRNRFDRMEWAGAFGDLGTLIPFIVGYIGVLKMDPIGVLFAFGVAMIVSGFYYKTPFPVQPMKAAGAVAITQAAQTAVITPVTVYAASLTTGIIWLILGLTGAISWIAKIVARPVVVGVILGLGLSFMLEGIRMAADNWVIGGVALFGTLLLLTNRSFPAMFLLLFFGAIVGLIKNPDFIHQLGSATFEPRLPTFALATLSWHDVLIGTVFLALPQLPLTLGNAVIVTTEENNQLFPDRAVTEKGVSISTGILNLFGSLVGGVPMCHGAGGMAGHVRFGAKTGGALIILGSILLCLSLLFSNSVLVLFKVFPQSILGVILFLTGAQLALGSCDFGKDKEDRFISLVTAGFAMWNIGLAFVVGMFCYFLKQRELLKL